MLDFIPNYGVPGGLFILMLISGTEASVAQFRNVFREPVTVLIGTFAQLVLMLPVVLVISKALAPPLPIATAIIVLALCPGGPISNYYCYVAGCNVSLSATITTLGTLCSLVSIPLL